MINAENIELNNFIATHLKAMRDLAREALHQKMKIGIMSALESIERGELRDAEEHLRRAMHSVCEVHGNWDDGDSLADFWAEFVWHDLREVHGLSESWRLYSERYNAKRKESIEAFILEANQGSHHSIWAS